MVMSWSLPLGQGNATLRPARGTLSVSEMVPSDLEAAYMPRYTYTIGSC